MPWLIPTLFLLRNQRSLLAPAAVAFALMLGGCTIRDPAPPPIASTAHPIDPPGQTQFESYCAGCHAIDGQGMEAEAPPLVGSSWVSGPTDRLIRILLHGVGGPIEVGGKTYNREMPGFGMVLADVDLASLASFVRSRFAGAGTAIDPAAVARIRAAAGQRKAPWSAAELME
jgi:mono/diheme cytochrome c family protein